MPDTLPPAVPADHAAIDASEDIGVNTSSEPSIGTLIERRLSRRAAILGLAGTAAAATLTDQLLASAANLAAAQAAGPSTLSFREIAHQLGERDAVAAGYEMQVLLRWAIRSSTARRSSIRKRSQPTASGASSATIATISTSSRCPRGRTAPITACSW
jgi:secreted PhoX family phosphatase